MADVTISDLIAQAPTTNDVFPFATAVSPSTYKASLAQIKTALAIPAAQIQSDWTQTNATALDYIKNKPAVAAFPAGFIGLWSGAANAIPAGWLLCDGLNGTPNLVDRFVVGAGASAPAVGTTGGSKDAIVVSHSHTVTDPGHSHSFSVYNAGNNGTNYARKSDPLFPTTGASTNSATTRITIEATGSSGTNANMPPYYALCYIMKS